MEKEKVETTDGHQVAKVELGMKSLAMAVLQQEADERDIPWDDLPLNYRRALEVAKKVDCSDALQTLKKTNSKISNGKSWIRPTAKGLQRNYVHMLTTRETLRPILRNGNPEIAYMGPSENGKLVLYVDTHVKNAQAQITHALDEIDFEKSAAILREIGWTIPRKGKETFLEAGYLKEKLRKFLENSLLQKNVHLARYEEPFFSEVLHRERGTLNVMRTDDGFMFINLHITDLVLAGGLDPLPHKHKF